jgi:hypothetical protein
VQVAQALVYVGALSEGTAMFQEYVQTFRAAFEAAGTETAGTETAGTETAGTETAGTETAGTEAAAPNGDAPACTSRSLCRLVLIPPVVSHLPLPHVGIMVCNSFTGKLDQLVFFSLLKVQ